MLSGGAHGANSARLCLVVPCYDEAARLDADAFRSFLSESGGSARVLFVNDGSRDATLQVLERLCREAQGRAAILNHERNLGKAEAVRTGVLHALNHFDQEAIGYWDADLATPLDAPARFLQVLDKDAQIEMVFGSRVKLLGRYIERRAVRHYLGRVFATAVSAVLHLPIYDSQCGAKLFRVNEHFGEVFARPFLSKWVFDVEILARYLNLYGRDPRKLERAIYEYPLEKWADIAGSKVRPADFFKAFVDVLKIRRRYL